MTKQNTMMNTTNKMGRNLAVAAAFVATAFTVLPAFAGRGASRAEVAGAIRNGGIDAIIATLEKAENMPATSDTVALVEGLLDHQDFRAREVAAWWFARRAAEKNRLTTSGLAALQGSDSVGVRNAADMLGTFRHPRVVSALAAASARTNVSADARMSAVRALGTIGHPAASPAIGAAMADTDAAVRKAAVIAWASIRRQSGAAPVTALLSDGDLSVRQVASRVAGQFAEASARTQLESLLATDADAVIRRNAAFALGRIGDAGSRAALTTAAESDASGLVRGYARVALRRVGL